MEEDPFIYLSSDNGEVSVEGRCIFLYIEKSYNFSSVKKRFKQVFHTEELVNVKRHSRDEFFEKYFYLVPENVRQFTMHKSIPAFMWYGSLHFNFGKFEEEDDEDFT